MRIKFELFVLTVTIVCGLIVFPLYAYTPIRSNPSGNSDQEFFSSFHTGTCLWDVYEWLEGALKFGVADEREVRIHENGSVTDFDFGSVCGPWTEESISSKIEEYFSLDIVPIIVFRRIKNFEDLNETAVGNFMSKMAGWVDAARERASDPEKFVIWTPAAEFNFPDGMLGLGWRNGTQKVDHRYYVPKMKMIREVRDSLDLQSKVLIGAHANLLLSYFPDEINEPDTRIFQGWDDPEEEVIQGFKGIDEYVEGFAQADVFGVSHYFGHKDQEENLCDLTWDQTLKKTWYRSKIIWRKVCLEADNPELPFYFFEYDMEDDIWTEAVTYTYGTGSDGMVHNNKWVKGINWYQPSFEEGAREVLVDLARGYDGYGRIQGDATGNDIVDLFDAVTVANAFGSKPEDPRWNPLADLNYDDSVDIFDVITVAKNFGKT